jgi:hypothetical protein
MSQSMSFFPSTASAYNDTTGRYSLRSQQADRITHTRSKPFSSLDHAPPFVVNLSGPIYSFTAYFTETVPENLSETVRSRKVEISYYIEDDSVEIFEPREQNSGLLQGKVLKRHQIAKPRKDPLAVGPNQIYTIKDFYAGAVLDVYNRLYTVIDCNGSTREHLKEQGLDFGKPLPLPATYHDPKVMRAQKKHNKYNDAALTAMIHNKKTSGFHMYDRMVLRFFGVWDCKKDLFGEEIPVRLHYFLADDTVEILPIFARNSGRDSITMLLKRTKVMHEVTPAEMMGDGYLDPEELESSIAMSRFSSSIFAEEKKKQRPMHWTDLKIGEVIPVAAMYIKLTDADGFTRQFFERNDMPLEAPVLIEKPPVTKFEVTIPPHNGFGSEIDSLTSCKGSLIPSAPHKDGAKLKAYQGMILRYLATLDSEEPANLSRKFIIQFHLEDDTIQILEPPQRNSGHKGGTFLGRCMIEPHDGAKPPSPTDLYLGATVTIFGYRFNVNDADEYTLRYMEENAGQWEHSKLSVVLRKVLDKEEVISRLILTVPGLARKAINYGYVEAIFKQAGLEIVKQEVVTIFRLLDPKRTGYVKLTKLLKFIMDQKAAAKKQ